MFSTGQGTLEIIKGIVKRYTIFMPYFARCPQVTSKKAAKQRVAEVKQIC